MFVLHRSKVHVFILFLGLAHLPAAHAQDQVVAYYPMWTRFTLPAQEVRYDLVTHILHAFAWPNADGSLAFHETTVDTQLINSTHRAGRKILLSFGGAGETQTANLALVVADSARRRAFIKNIVAHLTQYKYDGLDLDWEWPQTPSEREHEATLMRELRAAFNAVNPDLLLCMAVGVTHWQGQWHDFDSLKKSVDWFNAMAFNFHGSWSPHAGHNAPLFAPSTDADGSVDAGIGYLHQMRGIPTEQLVLGLAFYGRRFQAATLYGTKTEPTVDITYADAFNDMRQNWTYHWDSVSQVPYLTDPSGTYLDVFDDTASVALKCDYAKSHKLAGVMIWTLGHDLALGRQPLLETVSRVMKSPPNDVGWEDNLAPEDFLLLQNYPNPFNPRTVVSSQLSVASWVKLAVYDLLGREVAVLVDEWRAAGRYQDVFSAGGAPSGDQRSGRGNSRSGLSSGVYVYRLTAGSFAQSRTMVLLK